MKRLTMTALILLALTTGALAHEGSIGMYTDVSATDCDMTFGPFVTANITIMYYRSDSGPDGITAAEFKVDVPAGMMAIQSFTPSPDVSVTLGDISTGIACSYAGCTGTGSDYTLVGTLAVLPMVATPIQIRVLASNNITWPPYSPRVSICEGSRPIVSVLGGWFTGPDGTCSVGTEESTWGAIKDMYND